MAQYLVVLAGLCGLSTALQSEYSVKDYLKAPRRWVNTGSAPGDHILNLKIGLKQDKFNELEKQLFEVSTPSHPKYGQHLSSEQVDDLIRPASHVTEAVHEWLEEHGISSDQLSYSSAKDWITVRLPVSKVESLLDAEYSTWEHADGSRIVRTEGYSLPQHLHSCVSTIQPTNSWQRLDRHAPLIELEKRATTFEFAPHNLPEIPPPVDAQVAALCNFSSVTPECIRYLYGVSSYTPKSGGAKGRQSEVGICNYLGEYNNRSDTNIFLTKYRPAAASAAYSFPQISIADGPVDNGTNTATTDPTVGFEGNLDSEYAIGVGYPLPLTAYSTGGSDPSFMPDLQTPTNSDEPFLTWANYITAQPDNTIPQVISSSYGDDEQTVSLQYATAVCNQFAQLGARGVSLFFSAGDFGVGAPDPALCVSNKDNSTFMFLPSFPTDCPYVTVIGGTKNYPEVAANLTLSDGSTFASGAGFSNYFGMPAYQAATVNSYVAGLNGLYDGDYNKSGRAYPDISCIGQRFPVIWNGTTHSLVGTSGSSPICAAVIAQANDALLAAGRPPLGFLNPWLYSGGYKAFTDVTSGSSIGCGTNGFPATTGWDAVTGWGTPYLPSILKVLNL